MGSPHTVDMILSDTFKQISMDEYNMTEREEGYSLDYIAEYETGVPCTPSLVLCQEGAHKESVFGKKKKDLKAMQPQLTSLGNRWHDSHHQLLLCMLSIFCQNSCSLFL